MDVKSKGFYAYFLSVLIGLFSVFLFGCGPAVVGGIAGGSYAVISDERPVESQLSDSTISLKVSSKLVLVDDPEIRKVNIDVDTYQGIVYLSGVMLSQEQIDEVLQLAGSVNGVRMIKNNLQLKE